MRITRAQLRGKPLEPDCKRIKTIRNHDPFDPRTFCSGIYDEQNKMVVEKCAECNAYIFGKTLSDSVEKITNAEAIRRLSDKNLARFLYEYDNNKIPICQKRKCSIDEPTSSCFACCKKWLNQEIGEWVNRY